MGMCLRLLALLAGLYALALPAHAHPHAWIYMNATLQFNDKGVMHGIYVEWRFDQNYSEVAIEGLDTNKDGFYSPDELAPLSAENLKALKDYSYFTYLKANGRKVEFNTVTEYSQYYSNKTLTMSFTIPLKTPLDPKKRKVQLKIYDPSFYISMEFQDKNPVSASGPIPKGCSVVLKKLVADKETDKTRQMLADKPKEWTPETEEDFGALFAQPVDVDCKRKTAMR